MWTLHRVAPFRLAAKSRGRITPARRSIGRPWKSLSSREWILEILDQFRIGGQRLVGHGLRQLQADGAAGRRVEPDGRHGAVQVSGRVGEHSSRDWCARGPGPRRFRVEAGSGCRSGRWPSGRRARPRRPARGWRRRGRAPAGRSCRSARRRVWARAFRAAPAPPAAGPSAAELVGCGGPPASAAGAWPSLTSNRSALGWDVTGSAAIRTIENENKVKMKTRRRCAPARWSGPYGLPLETRSLDLAWLRPVSYRPERDE